MQGSSIPKAFQFSLGEEKPQEEVHPVTGVTDRYSLCDRFHEKNSSSAPDVLRRVTLVPELNAVINTEVEEQLHNSRSNYTFNMMLPGNHLFMMRFKIHLSNTHIDQVYRCKLEKAIRSYTGTAKGLRYDTNGILLLAPTQSVERESQEEEEGNASEGHDTDTEKSFAEPIVFHTCRQAIYCELYINLKMLNREIFTNVQMAWMFMAQFFLIKKSSLTYLYSSFSNMKESGQH